MALKTLFGFDLAIFFSLFLHAASGLALYASLRSSPPLPELRLREVELYAGPLGASPRRRGSPRAGRLPAPTAPGIVQDAQKLGSPLLSSPSASTSEAARSGGTASSASPGQVYGEDEVDVAPKLQYLPRLPYPARALREGVEGKVVLILLVDRLGHVVKARVIRQAGYGFDEAALKAATELRFQPGMKGGSTAMVQMKWTCHFRLEG